MEQRHHNRVQSILCTVITLVERVSETFSSVWYWTAAANLLDASNA